MTIGQRVKQRRKELGLTQEELARRIGNSSRASICTVEKDREDLTTTRIAKLAKALETSPAFLMGWTNDQDQNHTYSLEYGVELINNVYNNVNNSVMKAFNPVNDSKEESTTYDPNDAFYESLTDEQKAEATRLYQLFQKADSAHRLAVESLLRETPQEPERQ
jgi:transcriptional regulator with XRE-family HTH domain